MFNIKVPVILSFVCLALVMYIYVEKLFHRDNFSVRITDNSGCNLDRYEIALPEKTVIVTKNQAIKGTIGALGKVDTLIHVYGKENKEGKISYIMRAKYFDCDDIVGESRNVKKGYLLYEYIKDGESQFQVRSTT